MTKKLQWAHQVCHVIKNFKNIPEFILTKYIAELNRYAKSLLHGKTTDRWFDKTFTMVVYKNGVYGVNVEHAWADAPITGHMMEEILYNEFSRRKYNSDGSCDADKTRLPFKPEKLR